MRGPADDQIRDALDKILDSKGFSNSERMRRFLRYTVGQTLRNQPDQLKEYAIGMEVFDRTAGYDPRVDSIVRVEARRLRSKLKAYYAGEGKEETIRISFRPGSYIPAIEGTSAKVETEERVTISPDLRPSIAVLPFASLSSCAAANDVFADGLTDELIHALSRLDQLRVVARTSAFVYKSKSVDVRTAGRELGVASLLEGSVRREGNRVRVTALLVDAASGFELWSGQFDRELTSIFAIQEDLAAEICKVLRVHLSGAATQIVPLDAYQFYLEGLFYSSRATPANLRKGIEGFSRALIIEPRFAAAHAGLAGCYAQLMLFGHQCPRDLAPLARAAIQEALSLNAEHPDALCWRGFLEAAYDWDWPAAERTLRQVLKLNANHVEARQWLAALVLLPTGRVAEALRVSLEATRLDPASLMTNVILGLAYYCQRDFAAATGQFRRNAEIDPGFYGGRRLMASVLLEQGEFEEAAAVLESALPLAGEDPRIHAAIGFTLGYAGREAEASAIASQLDEESKRRYVSPFDQAMIQIGLAQHGPALDLFWQAAEDRSVWLAMLNIDPLFDELREQPRFQTLLDLVFAKVPAEGYS